MRFTDEQQVELLRSIDHMRLEDEDEKSIMLYCAHQIEAWGIPLTADNAYEVHCLMMHPHKRSCSKDCVRPHGPERGEG